MFRLNPAIYTPRDDANRRIHGNQQLHLFTTLTHSVIILQIFVVQGDIFGRPTSNGVTDVSVIFCHGSS